MEKPCAVTGCDGFAHTKGWCQAHYARWKNTGDVGSPVVVRRHRGRQCSIDGCDRKHRGRGYCDGHLRRFISTGDPGPAEFEARNPGAICSIEECEKPIRGGGRGWCNAHYVRWSTTGSPTTPFLSHTYNWVGDDASYGVVHQRIRKAKGRAADHLCISCGKSARHWSYDHLDPAEKTDAKLGVPYSLDPAHYQPMCQPCHRRFDVSHMPIVICTVDGCEKPQKGRSLCKQHYKPPAKVAG